MPVLYTAPIATKGPGQKNAIARGLRHDLKLAVRFGKTSAITAKRRTWHGSAEWRLRISQFTREVIMSQEAKERITSIDRELLGLRLDYKKYMVPRIPWRIASINRRVHELREEREELENPGKDSEILRGSD